MNLRRNFNRRRRNGHLAIVGQPSIPPAPPMTLRQLHDAISDRLNAIGAMIPSHKLTLIARWTGDSARDADILLSADDLTLAAAALAKMSQRPPTFDDAPPTPPTP